MSDQCSSVFLPVPTIPLLSNSSPTALDLLRTKISNWEVFASHLPGVTQSLIESIKREDPPPQHLKKLLDSWLHICPHASWLHVFIVLLEIKEDELYLAILEDLSSKRPPLSTTRYVVGASKDVVVHNIKDLSQWFTTLLQEVKSTLSDKPLQELVNETKRFLGLEGGLGQGITNINQLFNEVQPYCNYLNIELIQYLTRTTTPALASSVTKYAKNLLSFLQSAQLEFVTSAMTKPTSSKTKTTSAVTLKLSYHWNKYSLYTLLRAMECCLKVKAIYIRHIIRDKSDSRLLFKLFLPHQLCEHISTLLASNQKQISQFGIMKVDLHTSGHSPVFTSDIEFASFESSCFRAITDGNAIVLVTMLLLQLVFTDCTNREEETPLMIAAEEGQQQILHTLLAVGANVDAFSKKGQNASMIAFQRNQSAAVRILNKAMKNQQINRRRSASILVKKPQKKKEAQKDVDNASKGGAEHIITSDAPSEVGGDGKEQGKHIESPSIKEAASNKADEGSTVAASVDTKQNDESIKKGPCAPVSHTHEEKETYVSVRHYGPESQNESQSVSKLPTLDAASAVPNEKKEIVREQGHSSLPSQHTQQEQADAVDQASVSSKIHKGKKLSTNEGIKKCSDTEAKTAQKQKKPKIEVPPPLPAADIKEEESTENNDQGPQKSQSKITLSPEYKSLKKNMAELADLLSDDPDQIIQVANHLHSNDIIPVVTYRAAKNNHRSAMDRASFLLDSALKTFKANPNRKKLFDVFCTSLERSGIDPTTLRHDAETDATKKESSTSTAESLKQIASQDPIVVHLDKEDPDGKVESKLKTLNKKFEKLVADVRKCFVKHASSHFDDVIQEFSECTQIEVKKLKEEEPNTMFDLIKNRYNPFNYDIIENIIENVLKDEDLMKELNEHQKRKKEFERLTPIEHIIKVVIHVIPPVKPPTDSCTVHIKVNEVWGDKTKECLINFLNRCLGRDITSHVYIYRGSICVQFFIPMVESQDIIDRVMSYREDMYQLGVFYMFIGETEIINENDSIDLNEALHYFAQNGKHDEVLMSLELGADIDWKNKDGKTALMLATEAKQIQVIKKLRTAGADDSIRDNEGNTALDIARETDSRLLSYLTRDKTDKEEDKREEENKELEKMKKKDESKKEKEPEKTAGINLEDPAEQECRLRITQAENHEDIYFQSSRADTVKLFLALLEKEKLKRLVIHDTKLTRRCIKSLANLITTNNTLEELELINCGEKKYDANIFEEKLAEDLCAALVCNTTLKKLSLRSMRLSKGAIKAFIDMLHYKQKHLIHLEIDADYHEALCLEHSYYKDNIKERLRLVKGEN